MRRLPPGGASRSDAVPLAPSSQSSSGKRAVKGAGGARRLVGYRFCGRPGETVKATKRRATPPEVLLNSTPRSEHRPRRGAGAVRGTARMVSIRSEPGQNASTQVMTFRVERYDQHGDRLPPALVEIRGYSLEGNLSDGEEVAVSGTWRRAGWSRRR